jgi:glycerol-3-phosphate dehydrogenase
VRTTLAACALADLHGVEMPIARSVRDLLAGEVEPKDGVELLLRRQLRSENE